MRGEGGGVTVDILVGIGGGTRKLECMRQMESMVPVAIAESTMSRI